ncbi:NmrA family NAD(P)-binding protein [Streptomyces sp. NPDC017936]|uniref:NmrA family NAD(P)-binding protein n=1 Tax=Streptomyces sp. NPDC017936 TaxID=3365016 RepID=UPI003789C79F
MTRTDLPDPGTGPTPATDRARHGALRAPAQDTVDALVTRTPTSPVLVTGATGRIGRGVVDHLVGAGVPVRALTRRAEAAVTLPPGVEVVTGDLTVPTSLDGALRGVGAVFLLWTAPPATAAAVVERLAAHAPRVVFLSSPHRTPHPFFRQPNPMAVLHAEIERLIAATGLESTIIRPGMFASNALAWWAPAVRAGDVVRWPYGAAETAPVDDRDIAAVAARTLYQDGHAGGDYVLTGPESLSQAAQVDIIGKVLGRPTRFEELSPDEFRSETEGKAPRPVVDMLLAAWGAAVGRPAFLTSAVSDVLGVPPRSFSQWVADHAGAFEQGPVPST